DLKFAPLRGNVDTRLRKLAEGQVAGLVLAAAGLKRLGLEPAGLQRLSTEIVVPAPGQGALAVEAKVGGEAAELLRALDHSPTRRAVELERAVLRALGGGCSTPLGALARCEGEDLLLDVFWSDPAGAKPRRLSGKASRPEELASLVDSLAARLRAE
ncbi:MAG TPA: hydroxymethylbilane synthase, partial [Elusimicrobiota bacterium]|nr:hydroxymethylbilane synthase [Elusimicrobiota bacterium]